MERECSTSAGGASKGGETEREPFVGAGCAAEGGATKLKSFVSAGKITKGATGPAGGTGGATAAAFKFAGSAVMDTYTQTEFKQRKRKRREESISSLIRVQCYKKPGSVAKGVRET